MDTKEFTIAQILDAMEQNGLPQARSGNYFERDNDHQIVAGCAYGQAAINLGVEVNYLHKAMIYAHGIFVDIIGDNDSNDMSLKDIANKYRELAAREEILDEVLELVVKSYDKYLDNMVVLVADQDYPLISIRKPYVSDSTN